jgi:hypothetical protein
MSLYLNSSFTPKSVTVSNIFVPSGSSLFISGNLIISGTSYLSDVFIDTSRVFTVGILYASDIYASNLYGNASSATTSSYALTGPFASKNSNQFNGNQIITGSLTILPSASIAPIIIKSSSTPTAIAGGMYFDGADYYLGFP